MPQIDLRLGLPAGLALTAILAAVAVAVYFYRTTLPPVSRTIRTLLTVLRSATLALLVFVLCEPVLRLLSTRSLPPVLTVLVDDSRSMSTVDHNGARADAARSLLTSATLTGLTDRATVRILPFGTKTRMADGMTADSLSFTQDGTDIASGLADVQRNDNVLHSNAILLITDGIVTRGQNPLTGITSFPFPVTTVVLGDSSEQRDIALQRIVTNTVAYSGTPTPVQVMIHASGYQDERVAVSLTDGTALAGRYSLTLEPGSRDYVVPFSWTPGSDGVRTLTATVSSLPGELTTRNNRRSFSVRVRKSKLRILIVAGEPSHDLAFFRTTAAEDPNVTVSALVQAPGGGFLEGSLTQALLDSADCLVLIGMPTPTTPPSTMDALAAAVSARRIPLLWIAGRSVALERSGRLNTVLPFSAGRTSAVEQEISLEPAATAVQVPLFSPGTPGDPPPWSQLPPIYSTRTVFTPQPASTVLATARIQNVSTSLPVIVIRSRPQRSAAILGYGIWRWRLLAQRSPAAAEFFSRFVANTVYWLTSPDETAPVVVKPLSPLYGQGEPLAFSAQVQDVQQRPVEDAEVRVVVRLRDQASEGVLASMGNGLYEGTVLGANEEGVYAYRASAGKAGMTLGADSGTVRIGGTHVEFLTLQSNAPLLRALAARTGGASLDQSTFSRLPEELARQGFFTPRTLTDGLEIQGRSWPYVAAAIVLLLALEWFIRKRNGML